VTQIGWLVCEGGDQRRMKMFLSFEGIVIVIVTVTVMMIIAKNGEHLIIL